MFGGLVCTNIMGFPSGKLMQTSCAKNVEGFRVELRQGIPKDRSSLQDWLVLVLDRIRGRCAGPSTGRFHNERHSLCARNRKTSAFNDTRTASQIHNLRFGVHGATRSKSYARNLQGPVLRTSACTRLDTTLPQRSIVRILTPWIMD